MEKESARLHERKGEDRNLHSGGRMGHNSKMYEGDMSFKDYGESLEQCLRSTTARTFEPEDIIRGSR